MNQRFHVSRGEYKLALTLNTAETQKDPCHNQIENLGGWFGRTDGALVAGIRRRSVFLMAVLVVAALAIPVSAQNVFFRNVDVFDGQKKVEKTNVLIVDGKIVAVGQDVEVVEGAKAIDGTGKTLLPGLIDCHTHIWFESQLEQAAMFGVTTELDMMSSPMSAANFRRQQAEGKANKRADMFSAGAAVTVKDGHGTQFGLPVPTLAKAEDAAQFVNDRIREGSDYIKLILEDGSAYGQTLPTLSDEMFQLAVKAAKENNKLAVSHVSTEKGAKLAIASGINGLVHLFAETEISDDVLKLAKAKGVFVVPTCAVVSNSASANKTKMVVEDEHLMVMLNNENLSNLSRTFPVMPGATNSWDNLKHNVLKLHKAGVPILAGTDSPNPGTVHGVSMHQELRMLVMAGLSNEEALAAATSVPAKSFGLKDRGRIAAGLRGDVFLVDGDPTKDVAVAGNIVGVWKAGHAIDRSARLKMVVAEKERAKNRVAAAGEDRPISDFEGESISASFGAGWSKSTDSIMGGTSTVDMKLVDGGAAKTKKSLAISGKTQAKQPAFSGVMFSPAKVQMQPADVSAHSGISFWAKRAGEKDETCQVMLFFSKRGFMPSMKTFEAGKEWKQYQFEISDFDGCDGTDLVGIWFGKGTAGEFKFQIDQVQLDK